MHAQVSSFVNEYDINFPQLPDFDLSRVETEWARLRSTVVDVWKFNNDGREFQVGDAIKARNLSAEHPVVLIPGIISTVRLRTPDDPILLKSRLGLGILVDLARI